MSERTRLVAGVDGCPAGWVVVAGADGGGLWMSVTPTLAHAVQSHPRVAFWAVDMPIGLATEGPRECDQEARRRLGPKRASSVFPAPPYAALAPKINTYDQACHAAARATGKRISKQAWNLAPKIRDVRGLLVARPALRRRVLETHPELIFARLADGTALAESKKTEAGRQERMRLLAGAIGGPTVDRLVAQTDATRGVGIDDTLDAAACWLAADRASRGEDESLPVAPPTDPDGLACCIRF